MAALTSDDLITMDYAFLGQPFVFVPAKSSIDTLTMDYAHLGQPFVTNEFTQAEAPVKRRSPSGGAAYGAPGFY